MLENPQQHIFDIFATDVRNLFSSAPVESKRGV